MLSSAACQWARPLLRRSMGMAAVGTVARAKHTLPQLPYDFGALEPAISGEIMQIHYTKHHQTYVNNLNAALEKLEEATAKNDVNAQIALQSAIKFNGGGHINHSIFWENLAPQGTGGEPSEKLMSMIKARWGSFDNFQSTFNADTAAIQGSGWGWLAYDKKAKALTIQTCANQDPLNATTGLVPLLGVDVWEHAYYLQYKNVRPDYLKAIWGVINWKDVNKRLDASA